MPERAPSRRALLRGTAVGVAAVAVAGCEERRTAPAAPSGPDPEARLIAEVIAEKERILALYRQALPEAGALAGTLQQFERSHLAHLTELRTRLPADAALPGASPSPGTPAAGSPASSPTAAAGPSLTERLREAERKAAAARPRQIGSVSPSLAQLLASIGACEAVHAYVLSQRR